MNRMPRVSLIIATMLTFTGFAASATEIETKLTGAQEVPPVQTNATGTAEFSVKDDGAISGHVKTQGLDGTMAHIHEGAPGTNGGVVVPLEMKKDGEWVTPKDAKLTDPQMQALKAGNLYVNVHSDAHKNGEIRGKLDMNR